MVWYGGAYLDSEGYPIWHTIGGVAQEKLLEENPEYKLKVSNINLDYNIGDKIKFLESNIMQEMTINRIGTANAGEEINYCEYTENGWRTYGFTSTQISDLALELYNHITVLKYNIIRDAEYIEELEKK